MHMSGGYDGLYEPVVLQLHDNDITVSGRGHWL